MGTTRTSRRWQAGLAAAVAAAALTASAIAWLSPSRGSASEPRSFWPLVSGHAFEVDPPQDVDAISRRADAIVLGHVTGVVDGRQDPGSLVSTPAEDGTAPPRTCFVQVTVDKVVKGAVAERQVLRLEMSRPPAPLSLSDALDALPQEQLLFFLREGSAAARRGGLGVAAELREQGIYWPAGSRGVLAARDDGLVLPLRPDEGDPTFVRSFGATTVQGAAERAARAVR